MIIKSLKKIIRQVVKSISRTKISQFILKLLPHDRLNKIPNNENKLNLTIRLFFSILARYSALEKKIYRNVKFKFIRDFSMKLDVNEFTQCGYYFGAPDKELIQLIRLGGETYLDIGANVGMFTLIASQTFEKVIAFEPNPDTFRMLENNINLNKIGNITAYNIGLSDQNSIMKLYHNPLNNGGASLNKFSSKINKEGDGFTWNETKVEVKILDSIIGEDIKSVDLIKIDVEGHELPALKGALGVIKTYKPLIFAEVSGDYAKVMDILSILPESLCAYSMIDKQIISQKYVGIIPNDILFFPQEKNEILNNF